MSELAFNSPEALTVSKTFGPPLPASELIFKMPPSTQARFMSFDIKTFFVANGVTLQTISLHDENGIVVFNSSAAPLINFPFAGQATASGYAGPEQARVPFFRPNVLIGTIPKDLYALPGYEFRFNNIATVIGRSAKVTLFLSVGNE